MARGTFINPTLAPVANQAAEEPEACPFSETDEKIGEAHYFLHRALEEYHDPRAFRCNLNAFLQALRSVTLYLQAEGTNSDGFAAWYAPVQVRLREDALLRRFLEGRNVVAHRRSLVAASTVEAGLFRYRTCKLAFQIPIPASTPSEAVLRFLQGQGKWVDEHHTFIGEQLGVRRTWKVPELDPNAEVMKVCHVAWQRIQDVVAQAHVLIGMSAADVPDAGYEDEAHDVAQYDLLLESDLEPDAMRRWGWLDDVEEVPIEEPEGE